MKKPKDAENRKSYKSKEEDLRVQLLLDVLRAQVLRRRVVRVLQVLRVDAEAVRAITYTIALYLSANRSSSLSTNLLT